MGSWLHSKKRISMRCGDVSEKRKLDQDSPLNVQTLGLGTSIPCSLRLSGEVMLYFQGPSIGLCSCQRTPRLLGVESLGCVVSK